MVHTGTVAHMAIAVVMDIVVLIIMVAGITDIITEVFIVGTILVIMATMAPGSVLALAGDIHV